MSTNNYINELQRKNALYNMYFNGNRKYYAAGYCGGNITPGPKPKPPADVDATTQNDILNALSDDTKTNVLIRLANDIVINNISETISRTYSESIGRSMYINGKTVTIDLNGKKISVSKDVSKLETDALFVIKRNSTLIIDDSVGGGEIVSNDNPKIYTAIKLTDKTDESSGEKSILIINGGKIDGYYYAISGNGSRGNTEIVINGGCMTCNLDEDGAVIYNPQDGSVTINGGELCGPTGIYAKSGHVEINGGCIVSTRDHHEYIHSGNGMSSTGDAVVVERCNYPGKQITATINGGVIKSTGIDTNPVASYTQPDIEIERLVGFIKGGSYNKKIEEELISEGYRCVLTETGMYQVIKD